MEHDPPHSASYTVSADGDTVTTSASGPSAEKTSAPLSVLLTELKDSALYYLSARLDSAKVTARTIAIYAILGIVAAIVAVTALVVATWLAMTGLAWAIGQLVGALWAGYLIVGFGLLGGGALAGWLGIRRLQRQALKRAQDKYANWQQRQRKQYGNSVHERANRENE